MLLLAPDVEQMQSKGGLDDIISELIKLAKENEVRTYSFFEFMKKCYFSCMGVTDKTFQLARSVFSFHVEIFFLMDEPKVSLVIKD